MPRLPALTFFYLNDASYQEIARAFAFETPVDEIFRQVYLSPMSKEPLYIKDGPEALEWLRANGQPAALASNRFSSTAEAIAFVEQLYAAGAQRVFVPADTIVDDEEERELGGPYSDSLVIELSSSHVPDVLLNLYCAEATLEGYDFRHEPPPVIDGRYLFLWWD